MSFLRISWNIAGWIALLGLNVADSSGGDHSIRLRLKDGFRLTIPVGINGQGTYDFLLDTGAAHTSVDAQVARKLGLKAHSEARVIAYTGVPNVAIARARSITVGPQTVKDMDVLCYSVQTLFSLGDGIKGILGQDFLSRFNYTISYQARTVQFDEGGEVMCRLQSSPVRSKHYQGKFYIYTETDTDEGHSQRYLLDSGTRYPVLFELPAQEFRVLHNEPVLMLVTSGGQRKLRPGIVPVLRFGNVVLKNVRVMLGDPLPGERPFEDGLLPLSLFESIYFNNEKRFVILNAQLRN